MEGKTEAASSPQAAERTNIPEEPPRQKTFQRKLEVVSTILLAVTAFTATWSGYQASRWSGVVGAKNGHAANLRVEATRALTLAGQQQTVDVGLFTNWVNAYVDNKSELEKFYRDRFRQEFKPAFEAWVNSHPRTNPDAAPSPFQLPEYRLAQKDKAAQLEDEAAQDVREAQAANQVSGDYVRNALILATVMFILGISQHVKWQPMRIMMVIIATAVYALALYNVVVSPVA